MHCEKAKEWMACACTPPSARHKNDSEVSTRKHYGARKKALAARATGAAGIWRMAPLARHCGMSTPFDRLGPSQSMPPKMFVTKSRKVWKHIESLAPQPARFERVSIRD